MRRTLKISLLLVLLLACPSLLASAWSSRGPQPPPLPPKMPRVDHHQQKAVHNCRVLLSKAAAAAAACVQCSSGILLLTTTTTQSAAAATSTAAVAVAVDINAGNAVFEAHCAVCHAGGQNKFNPQRTLQEQSLEKFIEGGMTANNVQSFVQNSALHRGKFVLGNKLSEKDYQNVAAYVVEQASRKMWE